MLPEDTAPNSTAPPTLDPCLPAIRRRFWSRFRGVLASLLTFSSAACSLGQFPEHGVIEGGRAGSGWDPTDTNPGAAEASGTDVHEGSGETSDHSQATHDASTAEEASGSHDIGQETGELDSMDSDQTLTDSSGSTVTTTTAGSEDGGSTVTGDSSNSDESLESSADVEATESDTEATDETETTGDSDPPTLEPLDCSLEDNLSSEWGGGSTKYPETIYFRNESGATRRLYWLDGNGNRDFYASLKADSERAQDTRTSDIWLVTDNDRNCVEIFVGIVGESQALLR